MSIGVIIFSQTGNTRSVAARIREKLISMGHAAEIEEITIRGKTPAQPGKFELEMIPAADKYDALVFGAPVQAFTLNPVMKAYMERLPSLEGKKTAIFVTKQIPLLWVGGTGAVSQIKKACLARGAEVVGSEIVVWAEKQREPSITKCVENLSKLF